MRKKDKKLETVLFQVRKIRKAVEERYEDVARLVRLADRSKRVSVSEGSIANVIIAGVTGIKDIDILLYYLVDAIVDYDDKPKKVKK